MRFADTTVLVPLHRSARWDDVVAANLQRLIGTCRIVISDATGLDDTFSNLRERFDDAAITWLGPRSIDAGWIAHYDDLRSRTETRYFMWLPHDDEVDADYVRACRAELERSPAAAGAFGWIDCIEEAGTHHVELHRKLPERDAGVRANQLVLDWNLGIAFRSLFRTDVVPPLLDTTDRSEWADIVWCYGIALEHDLVPVPDARYRKRFHATSAHAAWRPHVHPGALAFLCREVDRRTGLSDAEEIRRDLIERSTERGAHVVDALRRERDELAAALHRTVAQAEDEDDRAGTPRTAPRRWARRRGR